MSRHRLLIKGRRKIVEALAWISIILFALVVANNIQLRNELKKKIDFEYEQYLLFRKTKD
jgi:hypothetical protein